MTLALTKTLEAMASVLLTGAGNEPSGSSVSVSSNDAGQEVLSLDQAYESITTTLAEIWKHFFGHLPLIVAAVVVLVVTTMLAYAARFVVRRLLSRASLRRSLRSLIDRVVMIGVWIIGLLLAAMVVFPGLTPTKALGGLGLASVAIGFAFKDMFENFFAGVLLLWRFPFEPGDFIECRDIVGQVEDTTIRMTTIRTPTDELIVVPNAFLFKNPVRVITHRDRRRVSIMTGVAYGVDLDEAVAVIEEAVSICESVADDRPVQVFPSRFGSSSMDIEVAWWCKATPLGERRSRGEVVAGIKRALDARGLEIPFPYRTLTFKDAVPIRSEAVRTGVADNAERDG